MDQTDFELDVVIPVFNEEDVLPELRKRLTAALDKASTRWRAILVDDGSDDRSREMIQQWGQEDSRIILVELSRNFGHQSAITAGISFASGQAVAVLDADLQDPPELLDEMMAAWRKGAEIVVARRRTRAETGWRRLAFGFFHLFLERFGSLPSSANTGVFGLMDRRVAQHFQRLSERHRFFPGLRDWLGFHRQEVLYDREERAAGTPKQSLRRLISYALDSIFSFSYQPLRMMTCLGLVIALAGFLLAGYFITKRLLGIEIADTGFTTLVTLILVLGGFNLIGLGLVGEYVGRIYDEVKNRPFFIVRATHGFASDEGSVSIRSGEEPRK
ncbi:glycosyltransferase family 2 protein [Cerasicoccus arenae]|uniref:Glycosyl transferase n=1 Tax=Cerasicoccus arenae TaxID=424488 RepID=A0A8J3GCC0_9BACT|nr:glycosyltransferase family 2 protein [Cerasicoccus arenae]MBK1859537.1 glycosyltransferase family 2 protein [Cerasicoccus arenae]GHB97223.1 glycosyl transferase [Cerasicoccus arenae]